MKFRVGQKVRIVKSSRFCSRGHLAAEAGAVVNWLRRAWTSVVQAMTTTPPEMIRQPKPDLESLYRYKRQRLRAWVRRKLFETPPEVVRPPKAASLQSRRRRALREGDFEMAERLRELQQL